VSQPSGQDLLLSAVTSSVFLAVIFGGALRRGWLSNTEIEAYLKEQVERLEHGTFSVSTAVYGVTSRLMAALYGSRLRTLAVTSLAAFFANAIMLSVLYFDWTERQTAIGAAEERLVLELDPEYAALVSTESGRATITGALAASIHPAAPGPIFHDTSPSAARVRDTYRRFYDQLRGYLLRNPRAAYDLTLARFFGATLVNPEWWHSQSLMLVGTLGLTTATAVLMDALAVAAVQSLCAAVFAGQLGSALALLSSVLVCFLMSLVNNAAFLAGHELIVFKWLLSVAFVVFLVAGFTSIGLDEGWGVPRLGATLALVAASGLHFLIYFAGDEVRFALFLLRDGINPIAVITAATTLVPLILVISVVAIILVAKACVVVMREPFLNAARVATDVAGMNYTLFYFTAIATYISVTIALVQWFNAGRPW
jgi:hypothetical protein